MRGLSELKTCFLAGTLEHGGAERQLFYMVQALCRQGGSPRVLSFDQGEFWEEPIRSLGVPITWVGQRNSRLARLWRVLRELRNDPPDVFQSQHFFANAYAGVAALIGRFAGIGAMRSDGQAEMRKNGVAGGWLNLRLPGVIAANSRLAVRQAISWGIPSSRLFFLPNVVDTERFRPPAASENPGRGVTLIAVGRIVAEKRFDRFVTLLGRLRARTQSALRGLIIGPPQDPELRRKLEAQAVELGLMPGCLEFVGGVSDLVPWYHRADICVLTSEYEGTPNVLLEAMASGLPVVSVRVGGVPDIVQHGKTGYVFDREDLHSLESVLDRLIKSPELRAAMGRRARETIEESFALHLLPAYMRDLYGLAVPSSHPWKPGVIEGKPC